MTFGIDRHTTLIEYSFYNFDFKRIGKKNNQSLGSMDSAGNSVNLVSGNIRSTSGWDFCASIGDR